MITLKKIRNDSIEAVVKSPLFSKWVYFDLNISQKESVDLNMDGKMDISILLDSIEHRPPKIIISKIVLGLFGEVLDSTEFEEIPVSADVPPGKNVFSLFTFLIILLALMVCVILFVILAKNNTKKMKSKR